MIAQPLRSVTGLLAVALAGLLLAGCGSSPVSSASGPRAESPPQPATRTIGDRAADIALAQVGTPYRYGGQSPTGFDCSGLVHYAYHHAGKNVPRTTGQLWSETAAVNHADLRPGDVLFFSIEGKMSHVGLYLGDGKFVHAPSSGRTVSVERLASPFYRKAFLRAGRPQ